jgi:hypothetical protein
MVARRVGVLGDLAREGIGGLGVVGAGEAEPPNEMKPRSTPRPPPPPTVDSWNVCERLSFSTTLRSLMLLAMPARKNDSSVVVWFR